MADNDYTEKEILMMLWQQTEDIRTYNSNRLTDAKGWHSNTENLDKRSSKHAVTDVGRELRKSKVCLRYIERKLKDLK